MGDIQRLSNGTAILGPETDLAWLGHQLTSLGLRPLEQGCWSVDPGLGSPCVQVLRDPETAVLRLELQALPPETRTIIAETVQAAPTSVVAELLQSTGDPARQAMGVAAAVATMRLDMLPVVESIAGSGAEAAAAMLRGELAEAQEAAEGATLMAEMAFDAGLFQSLANPDVIHEMLPTPNDCALLFHPSVAARIDGNQLPRPESCNALAQAFLPPRSVEDICAIPAGGLRMNDLDPTHPFVVTPCARPAAYPPGYAMIAGWLQPEPVWFTWLIAPPAHRAEGLVYVGDGRWVLFPRPYDIPALAAELRRWRLVPQQCSGAPPAMPLDRPFISAPADDFSPELLAMMESGLGTKPVSPSALGTKPVSAEGVPAQVIAELERFLGTGVGSVALQHTLTELDIDLDDLDDFDIELAPVFGVSNILANFDGETVEDVVAAVVAAVTSS